MNKISIFWFRRDVRLEDNTALYQALLKEENVLPLFIFDDEITDELAIDDARISFIYKHLALVNQSLNAMQSSLLCVKGNVMEVWKTLLRTYRVKNVYTNKDYEPYAIKRDKEVKGLLTSKDIPFFSFKDQVIFEESDIVKTDGKPYVMFTPYKNQWLNKYEQQEPIGLPNLNHFHSCNLIFPSLPDLGFKKSDVNVRGFSLLDLDKYATTRDTPYLDATSYLGPHLRFGTVSIRQVIAELKPTDAVFLSELIWREFFMQILYHFPDVIGSNFKAKYDGIKWLNNSDDFEKWCKGETGYPMVDAGMRQLNKTGYMHNRCRMITAGFLCKHLLIDWRWGEAYFASKLLDYELASNNGNWQWAAGTGCDSAPYFRIFNPTEQLKKFDKNRVYVKKWIPELDSDRYAKPMVEHKFARNRALDIYKKGLLLR